MVRGRWGGKGKERGKGKEKVKGRQGRGHTSKFSGPVQQEMVP